MKKLLFAVLTAGLFTVCTQENAWEQTLQANDHITVNAQIQGFTPAAETRTVINPTDYSCTWKTGDKIGMFSNHIDGETQTPSQLGLSLYSGNGTGEAIFTGSTGWKMNANGEYNYVAYYPFNEINTNREVLLDYTGQTQTANNSTAHLGDYDFMYSTATMPANSDEISFSFSHINALVNFKMAIPEEYKDRKFGKIRICAEVDIFTSQASYDIQNLIADGKPTITSTKTTNMIELEFGDEGINCADGVLDAWMMMLPAQWNEKEITIKLYDRFSYVIPLLEGKFIPTANQQASMTYSYNATLNKSEHTLPDKPKEGEQLHILLFGHSFGEDCMQYLPAITVAAGVTDVHYGRFYQADCSMAQHWGHWTAEDTYRYYDAAAGKSSWSSSSRSSKSVVAETPWDIIIFQTNISSSGEGNYNSFKEPLRNMVNEVVTMCEQLHHKTPLIGWNMFWGFNTPWPDTSSEDKNVTSEFNAIVSATKEMLADNTNVSLIIPTGTAVQNVRGTSLHDTTCMQQLTRDGRHIGLGFGRYVTACTWFQTLIAPIYGIDVEASGSYLPTDYTNYGNGVTDKVTTENRPILWKCAKAAALNPFEVTTIDELVY